MVVEVDKMLRQHWLGLSVLVRVMPRPDCWPVILTYLSTQVHKKISVILF